MARKWRRSSPAGWSARETNAFRNAGRQRSYRDRNIGHDPVALLVLQRPVRQSGIPRLLVDEARTFSGGHDWLAANGVEALVFDDPECVEMMSDFIETQPIL